MSHGKNHQSKEKAKDGKDELKMANERRIDALLELQNRYIRTARHLEENSSITDLDNLKHALKVQGEREARMENLKNIIAYGKHEEVNERKNIRRNLEFTDHYLQHHTDHMDEYTLEKTREKQEHRKEQMQFLD